MNTTFQLLARYFIHRAKIARFQTFFRRTFFPTSSLNGHTQAPILATFLILTILVNIGCKKVIIIFENTVWPPVMKFCTLTIFSKKVKIPTRIVLQRRIEVEIQRYEPETVFHLVVVDNYRTGRRIHDQDSPLVCHTFLENKSVSLDACIISICLTPQKYFVQENQYFLQLNEQTSSFGHEIYCTIFLSFSQTAEVSILGELEKSLKVFGYQTLPSNNLRLAIMQTTLSLRTRIRLTPNNKCRTAQYSSPNSAILSRNSSPQSTTTYITD